MATLVQLQQMAKRLMDAWGDFTMAYNEGRVPENVYQQMNQQFANTYARYENEIRERMRRMRPRTPERQERPRFVG